ncbi:MAG: Type IV pilus assembly protein PilB [Candidatus Peregrinibacteria bacterium GW2011_GWA2_33_10]|nr:MAG: Type IV pilus assembly protein PilB [Candidatus Peregrinibacteria bacterium GW2011_GWA2_33_10]KKP41101.1 MAG: type IV pilus assembly protein PilB, type IV pilus assembly protein PilB [Candidatus Peregrinibacteria bacterium GW2011_GWC2_33_13]
MADRQQTTNPIKNQQNEIVIKADNAEDTSNSQQRVISEINRDFKERSVQKEATETGLSYVDLSKIPINPELLYLLKPEEAKNAMLMPFFRIGKKLRIALVDPSNSYAQDVIQKLKDKNYKININLTSKENLDLVLNLYNSSQYKVEKKIENIIDASAVEAYEKEIKNLYNLKEKIASLNSEEALNLINIGAYKTNASDIHLQPEEGFIIVRFRIDGILQEIFRIDTKIFINIANQIKYKAKMKLNISNIPQDGRYGFQVNENKIDVRVNSLPTEFGEAFVCRLLDSKKNLLDFTDLGFRNENLDRINHSVGLSHGMILLTGPTGSGKTTTLYSMLGKYNTPEKKIITLEDPIEYNIENVTQSQINPKRDYTFATGLKAILRQDPDVVMIGEIRDLETAETAAQAALTGHVVLSTLHANGVVETVARLVNMGLPEFVIAPALNTVIAQRLVRKICPNCQTDYKIKGKEYEEIARIIEGIKVIMPEFKYEIPKILLKGIGCEICSHSGYKGQIAILEIINFDDELKDKILHGGTVHELFEISRRKRMLTMEEDGILKVIDGTTTLEEIHRVTKVV